MQSAPWIAASLWKSLQVVKSVPICPHPFRLTVGHELSVCDSITWSRVFELLRSEGDVKLAMLFKSLARLERPELISVMAHCRSEIHTGCKSKVCFVCLQKLASSTR
jgi:hypothetical protein